VVDRWFTEDYAEREPGVVDRMRRMVAGNPAEGYTGCCAAIEHMDLRPDLPRIGAPTLVVAGADDAATPPEDAERIAAGVPGARLHVLGGGAHLASWERAEEVGGLLAEHFGRTRPESESGV